MISLLGFCRSISNRISCSRAFKRNAAIDDDRRSCVGDALRVPAPPPPPLPLLLLLLLLLMLFALVVDVPGDIGGDAVVMIFWLAAAAAAAAAAM